MGLKGLITGDEYPIRVRRRTPTEEFIDKGKIIEDEDTNEKQLKLKSDGETFPKPGEDKFDLVAYRKWWHKLLVMPKQRTKGLTMIDHGDGEGDFVEYSRENEKAKAAGSNRIWDTHRNLMGKKYLELTQEEDNTQLWLAAYLSVLALITLGGMYVITQGIEDAVAQAVKQGIQSGLQAGSVGADNLQSSGVPDGSNSNYIPVIGLTSVYSAKWLKNRFSSLFSRGGD